MVIVIDGIKKNNSDGEIELFNVRGEGCVTKSELFSRIRPDNTLLTANGDDIYVILGSYLRINKLIIAGDYLGDLPELC